MAGGDRDDGRTLRASTAPEPPTLDGKYRLSRKLGQGGMGTVFEAEHIVLGRRCAVKFLNSEIAHDPEAVRRFIREARAASAIGHRGIVDVYDVGTTPQASPFLVMELLHGETLAARLAGGRKLAVADAAELVAEMLDALQAAHEAGIVHRDLKPENLFLVPERGAETVKILDFGISRMKSLGAGDDMATRTGTVLGTPSYMAPEQAAGSRDVDHRADVYAAGVILFQCATGTLPYRADNYNQLILRIATEPFPRARDVEPSVPEAFDAVILRATARNRDARFPAARALQRALRPFLTPKALARLGLEDDTRAHGSDGDASVAPAGRTESSSAEATPPARVAAPTSVRAGFRPWMAATAFGLAAALGLLLWRPWADRAEPNPVLPAGARPGPLAADPAPAMPADESYAVTIRFLGLPADATILYDGAYVTAAYLPVRRGSVAVLVEIRVPGYETFKQWVVPERDVDVVPTLEKAATLPTKGPNRDAGPAAEPRVPGVQEIRAAYRARLPAIRTCYSDGLATHLGLAGAMAMLVVVHRDGTVDARAELDTPEFAAAGVTACIVRIFSTLDFTDRGPFDEEVRARIPLSFAASTE